MRTRKIIDLFNDLSNKEFKFVAKKWYVIDTQYNKKINTTKKILLNLKQKALDQVFVIILMHLF